MERKKSYGNSIFFLVMEPRSYVMVQLCSHRERKPRALQDGAPKRDVNVGVDSPYEY